MCFGVSQQHSDRRKVCNAIITIYSCHPKMISDYPVGADLRWQQPTIIITNISPVLLLHKRASPLKIELALLWKEYEHALVMVQEQKGSSKRELFTMKSICVLLFSENFWFFVSNESSSVFIYFFHLFHQICLAIKYTFYALNFNWKTFMMQLLVHEIPFGINYNSHWWGR